MKLKEIKENNIKKMKETKIKKRNIHDNKTK